MVVVVVVVLVLVLVVAVVVVVVVVVVKLEGVVLVDPRRGVWLQYILGELIHGDRDRDLTRFQLV